MKLLNNHCNSIGSRFTGIYFLRHTLSVSWILLDELLVQKTEGLKDGCSKLSMVLWLSKGFVTLNSFFVESKHSLLLLQVGVFGVNDTDM